MKSFHEIALDASLVDIAPNAPRAERELGHQWSCSECDRGFHCKRGPASHQFKIHGKRSAWRKYLHDTFCPACLVQFHTRERLLQHVAHNRPACGELILRTIDPMSEEQAEYLDSQALILTRSRRKSGRYTEFAEVPCFRMSGPLADHE